MRTLPLVALIAAGCTPAAPTAPAPAAPAAPAGPALSADQRVESPGYARWAAFAPGTAVVFEEVAEEVGGTSVTASAHKFVQKTDAAAVVESTASTKSPDGRATEHPVQELKHLRWMGKPADPKTAADPGRPAGTYASGTETITVRGKRYDARWYKFKGRVEAGETDAQSWYADAVPGGLVKSVFRVPAVKKTVTTELVEVRTP